jgi:glutaredoxin
MMNKQTLVTSILILVIVGLLTTIVLGSNNKTTTKGTDKSPVSKTEVISDGSITFFYGNTCPHCADVEAWMKENRIEEKVTLTKKEVYDNMPNSIELTKVAEGCGLPTDSIGVPFLYAEGKCFVGSPDVIGYITKKAAMIESSSSAERSQP